MAPSTNLDFLSLFSLETTNEAGAELADLDCLHKRSLQWGGEDGPEDQELQTGTPVVFIKTLTGKTLKIRRQPSETV